MTETSGGEMLLTARWSGAEVSNLWNATNRNWTKLRTPHWPGGDFRREGHTECIAVAVPDFLRAQACRAAGPRHELSGWLPHPTTQADPDVAIARIRSAEVIEVRRTD